MALLRKWELSPEEQLDVLGMDPGERRNLVGYRKGELPLPDRRDMLDRAGYLLKIHRSLRLLFPEDPALRYGWIRMRNASLAGCTPLEVIMKDGLMGLAKIEQFVAFQRDR